MSTRSDAIRECLDALDDLRKQGEDRSIDWKSGVEASRAILRALTRIPTARTRMPLDAGSLAEKVVAFLRLRRGTILTDAEISARFDPTIHASDIWFHMQVAVRDEYVETTTADGPARGYRAWGCSAELAGKRKYG